LPGNVQLEASTNRAPVSSTSWLSLLLWQPVAVLGMFFAARAFARRSLRGRSARRAALLIGFVRWFAAGLPLLYYLALAHADPQWGIAQAQS
jgi:hypothetical protein